VHVERGHARCLTRNGLDWTSKFPVLATVAGELPDCILDGELCAMAENGYSDFPALRSAIARRQTDALVFWAFDVLYLAGLGDLRGETLRVRKGALQMMLQGREEVVRRFIRWVEAFGGENGQEVFHAACELGFEGIVSKRLDAPYVSGPTTTWAKTKCQGWQARLR
jgi:bifunctional non-homologous end joining protein LigD